MKEKDIQSLLANLQISDSNSAGTRFKKTDCDEGFTLGKQSLLGKFITQKEINAKNFLPAMEKSWATSKFKLIKLGHNFYQISFDDAEEMKKVLFEGPWCFDNILFVLKSWQPYAKQDDPIFNHCELWIQFWGLPVHCVTEAIGKKIAQTFKDPTFLQIREEQGTNQPFFRLRTSIDISKPLLQVFYLTQDEEYPLAPSENAIPAIIQFERLPFFCYHCGIMGHLAKVCPKAVDEFNLAEEQSFQFKDWSYAATATTFSKLAKELRMIDMDLASNPKPQTILCIEATTNPTSQQLHYSKPSDSNHTQDSIPNQISNSKTITSYSKFDIDMTEHDKTCPCQSQDSLPCQDKKPPPQRQKIFPTQQSLVTSTKQQDQLSTFSNTASLSSVTIKDTLSLTANPQPPLVSHTLVSEEKNNSNLQPRKDLSTPPCHCTNSLENQTLAPASLHIIAPAPKPNFISARSDPHGLPVHKQLQISQQDENFKPLTQTSHAHSSNLSQSNLSHIGSQNQHSNSHSKPLIGQKTFRRKSQSVERPLQEISNLELCLGKRKQDCEEEEGPTKKQKNEVVCTLVDAARQLHQEP